MKLYFNVIVRITIGLTFFISGISKLFSITTFSTVLRGFDLLPEVLITFIAITLPSIELIVGLSLILGYFVRFACKAMIILLIIFITAIIPQLILGNEIDCGCFGPLMHEKIGLGLLMRDLILLGLTTIYLLQFDRLRPSSETQVEDDTLI